jgi:DNA-binding transcriptional LysR family regulator
MTLEQLAIYIAVAEREHLTRAAEAIGLTPSAVSAAIKTLESAHGIRLFDRVGRRIELSQTGRSFLPEARRALAAARQAEVVLNDLGDARTGKISIEASQTIANYWLPTRIMQFSQQHPAIAVTFGVGNTASVARSVLEGHAELGLIEGSIDEPALATRHVFTDELVIVTSQRPAETADMTRLYDLKWIMREPGSGTRTEFEHALAGLGVAFADLDIALTLPTNEAVLHAVLNSTCAAALSKLVVAPFLASGRLVQLDLALPTRRFTLLRHKERHLSAAARKFERVCLQEV